MEKKILKKGIVVCDIDDTVSIVGQRKRFLEAEVIDWKRFYEDDFNDKPIEDTCGLVARLLENGVRVVFSTSRLEVCRERTLSWLREHISQDITDEMLLMRPEGCEEPESVQKIQGVLSRFSLEDIAVVLDDNDSILKAWADKGVTTIRSAVPMGPSEARKRELTALDGDQQALLDEFVAAGVALTRAGVAVYYDSKVGGLCVVNTRCVHEGGDDRVEDYLSARLDIPVSESREEGHGITIKDE